MNTARSEDDAPVPEDVLTAFRRFVIRWETYRAQLATLLDVNVNDLLALMILTHGGPMPVSRLRSELNFTSGATTLLVDRLARYGLVERVPHEQDRRITVVRLTRHQEYALREVRRWLAAPLRTLGPAQSGTLIAALTTVADAFAQSSHRLRVELVQQEDRPDDQWRLRAGRRLERTRPRGYVEGPHDHRTTGALTGDPHP